MVVLQLSSPSRKAVGEQDGGPGGFETLSPAGGVGARWADTPSVPCLLSGNSSPGVWTQASISLSLPSWEGEGEGEVAQRKMVLRGAGWGGRLGPREPRTPPSVEQGTRRLGQACALRLSGGRRETGRWNRPPRAIPSLRLGGLQRAGLRAHPQLYRDSATNVVSKGPQVELFLGAGSGPG